MKLKSFIWIFVLIISSSFVFAVAEYPAGSNPFNATRIFHLDDNCGDSLEVENCTLIGSPAYNTTTPLDSGKSLLTGANEGVDSNFGANDFGLQDAFSTCFWWKQIGGDANLYFFGMVDTTATENRYYYLFHRDADDDMEFIIRSETSGTNKDDIREENNDDVTTNGNWHHICVTHATGGGADKMKIYRNGTRVDDTTDSSDTVDNVLITLDFYYAVRNQDGSPTVGMNAHLDDILIFNGTELTLGQIQTIYTGNYTLVEPPTNLSWNVTSAVVSGESRIAWNTGGLINITENDLSFTFTANEDSNWSCRKGVEQNYTQMITANINYKLATTETTSHAGTLYDNITSGENNCMYCSGIDASGNEPTSGDSSSGCLNFTLIDTTPPNINITSPINSTTYTVNYVDLNWTADETLDWCAYSLDGGANNTDICPIGIYTGFNFGVGFASTGITWNGSSFFVINALSDTVSEYNSSGDYTGFNFDVSGEEVGPTGITWNGSSFFIVGTDLDTVFEYNSSGNYTGFNFSVTNEEIAPHDITWNGSSFFVVGLASDTVFEYNSSGNYTGFNFYVGSQEDVPRGIEWDGNNFFVVGDTTKVFEYNSSGNYTGFNFSVASEEPTTPTGITWNGSSFFVIGATNSVYEYSGDVTTTNITLTSLSLGSHNVTIWGNDIVGNIGQSSYVYFTINLQYHLFMDGLSQDRKYEYGTTANLTTANFSGNVCFDILDDTDRYLNVSCGADASYNYTIDKLVVNTFNDSSTITNITNITKNITTTINNKTDLVDLKFNVTGFKTPKYPQNITIDVGIDNIIDAIIPGKLVGTNYQINNFILNDIIYSSINLTFASQGNQEIFLNITTNGNRTSNGTLNFTITVFDLDVGNELDYNQNFSSKLGSSFTINESINDNISSPLIDETFFNEGAVDKYNFFHFLDGTTYTPPTNKINVTCGIGQGQCLFNGVSGTTNENAFTRSSSVATKFDLRKTNQIRLETQQSLKCAGNYDYTITESWIYFVNLDDTSEIVSISYQRYRCKSQGEITSTTKKKYTIYKITDNSFKVEDGFTTTTYEVSSITGRLGLLFANKIYNPRDCGGCGSPGIYSNTYISNFSISGIGLNRTTGDKYPTTPQNWTSDVLFTAPSNIERAKFTSVEYLGEDYNGTVTATTTVDYWLSNDNGTTWELAVNDTFNDFDSTGKSLKIKAELDTNNSLVSPVITDLRVQIIPTSGCDLNIGVGELKGQEMSVGYGLNSSNTPIYYNGTDVGIRGFDCPSLTCAIPIEFTVNQSCMIQITNMNYTKNPNPLKFTNMTSIETEENPQVALNFSDGLIQISNWMLQFYGSKNITVSVYPLGDTSANDSQVIQVRYSQFDLYYPSGQMYWEIFPTSRNQSDIEPYGQNTSTGIWRINSSAYDDPFDIYVRYNKSIDSCVVNNTFAGMNLTFNQSKQMKFNVSSLSTTYQKLMVGVNETTDEKDIFTFTDILCGGNNTDPFVIPWYCFRARCQECVETFDFNENCSWSE